MLRKIILWRLFTCLIWLTLFWLVPSHIHVTRFTEFPYEITIKPYSATPILSSFLKGEICSAFILHWLLLPLVTHSFVWHISILVPEPNPIMESCAHSLKNWNFVFIFSPFLEKLYLPVCLTLPVSLKAQGHMQRDCNKG